MTDEQERQSASLMARAHGGDCDAYAALLTLLASVARAYARRRVGGAAWVEDVVQETLLSVHAARRTFDVRRPFAPWFYAIAHRRMVDAIRRERRIASREVQVEPPAEPRSEAPGGTTGMSAVDPDAVRAALRTLTVSQRRAVHALKVRDESVREASVRLGISETAVKVAAHRGYRALRKALRVAHRGH